MATETRTKTEYRIMVKMPWSSRFVGWTRFKGDTPQCWGSYQQVQQIVRNRIEGQNNPDVWDDWQEYPYEGAEWRIDQRTVTTTVETTGWK